MHHLRISIITVFLLLFTLPTYAQTNAASSKHLSVKLVSLQKAIKPGENVRLGVLFKLDPKWHVYWKNPGDSGTAPKFKFNINEGKQKHVKWPIPQRISVGHLTNYGYEDEVLIPIQVSTNKNPQTDSLNIELNLEWLVCKNNCIPGSAKLHHAIPFKEKTIKHPHEAKVAQTFRYFQSKVPKTKHHWNVQYLKKTDHMFSFTINHPDFNPKEIEKLHIFPEQGGIFKTNQPKIIPKGNKVQISMPFSENQDSSVDPYTFSLSVQKGAVKDIFRAEVSSSKIRWGNFFQALLFACLGGILLNLMPCVLPILTLKAFSWIQDSHSKEVRMSGYLYSLGVLCMFFILGLLLLGLRASGEAIGWGFQLQSSWTIFALAGLFYLLGLNFMGYFEWGSGLMNWASQKSRWSGSFGTGLLAVIVASPCTAPFMGSAIGATLFFPPLYAIFIFVSLGIGFALPLFALSLFPKLRSYLPKPGAWMVTLKEFFAFPLFATAIWLAWILGQQKGSFSLILLLIALMILTMALWGFHKFQKLKSIPLFIGVLAFVFLAFQTQNISSTPLSTKPASSQNLPWEQYSSEKIQKYRAQGKPIFMDFTASWCITCQWNKKSVLQTEKVTSFFKKNEITLIRADWTSKDKEITRALASFGRNSVPLYVFYPPHGRKAKILPQILNRDIILSLMKKKGDSK